MTSCGDEHTSKCFTFTMSTYIESQQINNCKAFTWYICSAQFAVLFRTTNNLHFVFTDLYNPGCEVPSPISRIVCRSLTQNTFSNRGRILFQIRNYIYDFKFLFTTHRPGRKVSVSSWFLPARRLLKLDLKYSPESNRGRILVLNTKWYDFKYSAQVSMK